MSSAYPPLQPLVAGQQSFHKHQLPQVGRSLEVQPPVTRQRELPSPYNHLLPHSSSNPKHVAEKSPQVLSAPSPPHTAPAQAPVREDEGELHMLYVSSLYFLAWTFMVSNLE